MDGRTEGETQRMTTGVPVPWAVLTGPRLPPAPTALRSGAPGCRPLTAGGREAQDAGPHWGGPASRQVEAPSGTAWAPAGRPAPWGCLRGAWPCRQARSQSSLPSPHPGMDRSPSAARLAAPAPCQGTPPALLAPPGQAEAPAASQALLPTWACPQKAVDPVRFVLQDDLFQNLPLLAVPFPADPPQPQLPVTS